MIRNNKGFTLVELVFTLTLVAIICSLGAISMKKFSKTNRFNSSVLDIRSILEVAKSEAVKHQKRAAVTFTTGTGPDGTYRLFIDDGATIGVYDGGETIVREGSIDKRATIDAISFGGGDTAVFNQLGLAMGYSGSVRLVNSDGDMYKHVLVTPGGVIRVESSKSGLDGTWTE